MSAVHQKIECFYSNINGKGKIKLDSQCQPGCSSLISVHYDRLHTTPIVEVLEKTDYGENKADGAKEHMPPTAFQETLKLLEINHFNTESKQTVTVKTNCLVLLRNEPHFTGGSVSVFHKSLQQPLQI